MRRLGVVLVVMLLALPLAAQQRYGSVTGVVLDDQQQPLPGVNVTLSGPYMQGTRVAVTDQAGRFRFVPVPPGSDYVLRFELSGFNTLEQSGIVVNVGKETEVQAQMALSQFAETITVSAERIVVDTTKSTMETAVEWKLLDAGTTTRHYNTIWYMIPGVPNAGQNNPSVHGAGGDDNAILIDGVDTTDPRTQTWGTQINWDTIQEAQVQTGGYQAEFGRAVGGIMNLITKSGGNEFHATFRAVMRDSSWNADPEIEPETGRRKAGGARETELRPNVTVGGPVFRDMLWFYVGYEQRDRDRIYSRYASYQDRLNGTLSEVTSNYKGHAASVKLTWQINPSHSLVGYWNEDPIDISNLRAINSQSYAPSAEQTQFQGGNNYSAQWYGVLSPAFFMEAKYQHHQQELNVKPQESGFGQVPFFADRNVGYYSGAAYYDYASFRDRDGLLLTGSYFMDSGSSSHQFKAGVEWLEMNPYAGRIYNPAGYYRSRGANPDSRYTWTNQVKKVKTSDTYWAIFLQDQWKIGKLTLNMGVRAESYSAKNNVGTEVVNFGFGDQIAPRLGFAYDLNGNSLHGSVSRFYDLPTGYISAYMSDTPTHQQYWTWNGTCSPSGNWWQTPDSCWTLRWDVPTAAGGFEVDPGLDPIYVDEVTFGYDHRLSDLFAAGINFVYRKQEKSIEDVDPEYDGVALWTNAPLSRVVLEDGTVVRTNYPWKEYQGVELVFKKRFGPDGFQFLGSYTYVIKAKGWQGTGGTTASTAYSQFGAYGDTPDDFNPLWYGDIQSPHWLKVYGSYVTPWKMIVGLGAYWNSGYLYTRYRPGDYGSVPLERQGSSEVGNLWEADLHLEQPFTLGPVSIALYADVENLFDNQLPTGRGGNSTTASTYNLPTSWQSSRAYVLGFKVEY